MYRERKFGWLLAITVITVALIFALTQTDLIASTNFFVEGSGEELAENVIDVLQDGNNVVVVKKTNSTEFDHLIDRIYDSPDLFWLDMKYSALSIGDVAILMFTDKYPNADRIQSAVDDTANNIITKVVNDEMSEYDRVLAIHDWLCENVIYGETDNGSDQDIYGALVLREARCAGYAKAFTYLLDKVGIESSVISGDSIDKYGNSVAHAWNLVYIDGEPYYFDITWNDNDELGYTYDWFGITSEKFQTSHFPSRGYDWVDADSTEACYYIKNGMYIEKYSSTNIARQIAKQGRTFHIKCEDDIVRRRVVLALENREELQKIMKAAGISQIDQVIYTQSANSNCLHIEIK